MRILFRVLLVLLCLVVFACGGASRITLEDLRAVNPTAAVERSCERVHSEHGELHLSVRRGDENVHFFEDSGDRIIEAVKDEKAIITVYEADNPVCVAETQANRSSKQSNFQYGVVWTFSEPRGDLPRIRLPEETRTALESSLRTECSTAQVSLTKGVMGQTLVVRGEPQQTLKNAQEITDIVRRTLRASVNELLVCGPLGCKTMNEMRALGGSAPLDPNAESPIDSPAAQFAGGAVGALPEALAPGGPILTQAMIDQGVLPKGTRWAQAGKAATEVVVGGVQVFVGVDGAIVGGGMTLTGGGAVAGVPLCIGSVGVALNGVATACNGTRNLTITLFRWEDEPAPSAPSSEPATSTPSTGPPVQPAAKPPAPAPAKPTQAAPAKPAPASPVVPTQTTTTTWAKLRPYGGPGGGHHVPAKKAFEGAPGYDANKAPAIPNDALKAAGVTDHNKITTAQMKLYKEFAATGAKPTWETIAKIETQALVEAGMKPELAHGTVAKAIQALKDAGIAGPVRTPWGGGK